jgi:hypothetical protein
MVSPLMMILGFQGIPPSKLGFVCKPDMPPHINILFRARHPLAWVHLPEKGKCPKYVGMIDSSTSILERFERTEPPIRTKTQNKRNLKLIDKIENIEKNKAFNHEKAYEYKNNIKCLSVRR